jgi:hypothetical protein
MWLILHQNPFAMNFDDESVDAVDLEKLIFKGK